VRSANFDQHSENFDETSFRFNSFCARRYLRQITVVAFTGNLKAYYLEHSLQMLVLSIRLRAGDENPACFDRV
jgi:hypothetical protein